MVSYREASGLSYLFDCLPATCRAEATVGVLYSLAGTVLSSVPPSHHPVFPQIVCITIAGAGQQLRI